jgi:hypothetical protein
MIIPKLPVPSCSGAQTYAFEGGLQAAHGGEGLAKHGDIYGDIIPNISWICMDMYTYGSYIRIRKPSSDNKQNHHDSLCFCRDIPGSKTLEILQSFQLK